MLLFTYIIWRKYQFSILNILLHLTMFFLYYVEMGEVLVGVTAGS